LDEDTQHQGNGQQCSSYRVIRREQQKLVIAKALAQRPKLIIFDEPTRGVDVGAIAEIHQIINKLADDGLSVIVISSYLPEVLHLSDRILVARQGRIVEDSMRLMQLRQ